MGQITKVATHQVVRGDARTDIEIRRVTEHHYELGFADGRMLTIPFQKGDPGAGLNGVTLEALLHLQLDKLHCHQDGPYPCAENERAIAHLEQALMALAEREARLEAEAIAAAAEQDRLKKIAAEKAAQEKAALEAAATEPPKQG